MSLLSKIFLTSTLLLGLQSSSLAANLAEDASTLLAASVDVLRNDLTATRLVISVPDVGRLEGSTTEGLSVNRFGLDLEPTTTRPGWPELPMVSRLVLIPPTGAVHFTLNNVDYYTEAGNKPFIVPEQDGSVDLDLSGNPAAEFLNTLGYWPPSPVIVGEPAILRGHRMVPVTIYPMQINPSTGEIRYNTNVDFELDYSGEGVNEVVNPQRPRPSSTINRLLESIVINPPPPSRDDPHRGSYLLVYYNANGIANALAPLITWRKRQGWEVQTLAIQVNTSANEIKNQIQRAYNEWDLPPEMVAIVGDPDWNGNGIPHWPTDAAGATDLDYARLDGNDILADVDYGRISCRTIQELNQVVAKIVNYESNPYMDNTDWYRQGAVCAGNAISGLSTKLVSKWVRRMTLDRGWDNVHEWYWDAQWQGQDVSTFFRSEIARGVNYVTYRGWIGMEGLSADAIMGFQATRRYPFATTMTCQSGQYAGGFCPTEGFFISPGGAIGSIGFATSSTHVPYNNAVFTGIWHGLLKLDLYNLGTACNYGRYNTFRQYAGFEEVNVTNFSKWANLMGDPATDMFTGIPQIVVCEHEENIPLGSTRISVSLSDNREGTPVANAQVCLFKVNDEFQMVVHTDENGVAEFAIPSDAVTAGNLLVTATKHNMKPYLGTIQVGQDEQFVGAESWEIQGDNNNNGDANPGETATLEILLKNFGSNALDGDITVSFESLSIWADVNADPIQIQNPPDPGESVAINLDVQIHVSAPNATAVPIAINIQNAQTVWPSMAVIQVLAPDIQLGEAFIANNRLDPGAQADIDFSLANRGGSDIEAFTAYLWSETDVVTVITDQVAYPAIAANRSARIQGNRFRIRAHPFAIPGMKAILKLETVTESGFRDTTTYTLNVGAQRVNAPFGPDKYGYVCFDSGDEGWDMAPRYDWIEIDPQVQNRDYNGTLLNLQDGAEDQDRSLVIDIPFDFQYYGEVFNRATVCTNGWFAFGNWGELSDFRNRRINSGEGPDGQLCVFWDDLNTGRILTYYDAENGRFIVEWNNMRSMGDGSTEIFELVLYDTEVTPTYSGDGVILFQYKDVTNPAGEGEAHDTPYVTIGINSPTDLDGLEYTYYNSYAGGAKRIEDGLAIKFTTAIQYITGILAIGVSDAATGAPVVGAQVATARGFWGESNADGYVFIDDILIGDYEYLTASAQGYNDSTWFGDNGDGFSILEAETLWVNISMLHPEFTLDREGFSFEMLADSSTTTSFNLFNGGNGLLSFTSRFTYVVDEGAQIIRNENRESKKTLPRDNPDELWDVLLSWDASTAVENLRLQSVAFIGDRWIVAGGHIANREDTLNYFYEFSRNGQYSGVRFPQTTVGLYGYRDMEYFDGLLYCTFDRNSTVVALDPSDFHVIYEWKVPAELRSLRNIAIDPNTGHIWASSPTSRIYELAIENDSALVPVRDFQTRFPGSQEQIHSYGISWFRDDPDGCFLYLMSNHESGTDPDAAPDNNHADVALFKMNPNTGEIRYLTDFDDLDPALQGECGIVITPKWNNLVWGLVALFDNPAGDQVKVFELAPNSSWITYSPHVDTLASQESIPIELTIESNDLDTGRYSVIIEFSHNAGDGTTLVPVTLDVVTELDIEASVSQPIPFEYALSGNFPNPFNSVTLIDFTLKEKGNVSIDLFDLQGRKIQSLFSGSQTAGQHRIAVDGAKISTGLYFYRLKAGNFSATRKMIIAK